MNISTMESLDLKYFEYNRPTIIIFLIFEI